MKREQITWRGENKLLFACPPAQKKQPFLIFLFELADRNDIMRETKSVLLFLDGKPQVLPNNLVAQKPRPEGQSYISWAISLPTQMAQAIKMADQIGGGLSPGNPVIFAGFRGMRVAEGRDKLSQFLDGCR